MNWAEALTAMLAGHCVRRRSESYRRQLANGAFETGEEACCIKHAWTADDKPVQIFVGACSRIPFVPDDTQRGAQDWEITEHI